MKLVEMIAKHRAKGINDVFIGPDLLYQMLEIIKEHPLARFVP